MKEGGTTSNTWGRNERGMIVEKDMEGCFQRQKKDGRYIFRKKRDCLNRRDDGGMEVDRRGRCKDGWVLDGRMMEGCWWIKRGEDRNVEDKDGGMLDEQRWMLGVVVKKGRWRKVWKEDSRWTDRCRGGWKEMKVGWRENRWRDVKKDGGITRENKGMEESLEESRKKMEEWMLDGWLQRGKKRWWSDYKKVWWMKNRCKKDGGMLSGITDEHRGTMEGWKKVSRDDRGRWRGGW